jgi:folylpolyglutamate synthase/dihydropteroate synthase
LTHRKTLHGQTCEFQYQGRSHSVLVPFAGNRQILNFATTTFVADVLVGLGILHSIEAILGIENASIPGRFEHIAGTPSWLLDVAHNAASLQSLIETTSMHFCAEDLIVVLGATQAHDYHVFVRLICEWGVSLCFCGGFTKCVDVHDLLREVPADYPVLRTFSSPPEAVSFLLSETSARNKTILVTGSLFLVGLVRLELIRRNILHTDHQATCA